MLESIRAFLEDNPPLRSVDLMEAFSTFLADPRNEGRAWQMIVAGLGKPDDPDPALRGHAAWNVNELHRLASRPGHFVTAYGRVHIQIRPRVIGGTYVPQAVETTH